MYVPGFGFCGDCHCIDWLLDDTHGGEALGLEHFRLGPVLGVVMDGVRGDPDASAGLHRVAADLRNWSCWLSIEDKQCLHVRVHAAGVDRGGGK